ncbi:hypothetical protein BDV26DRAFT_149488 [Aspergillus bertholletiae]|uniref:Uncharacterized protein n=1 Tax=Aspergillus bertholletiae TaxID=1226010 RepID=A0A5N7AQ06_9EURO|nr:hypothetical protein BDV26DRAFT_149488 [Aspergillus bertholletiae]
MPHPQLPIKRGRVGPPRLDPYYRLLHRFYEALFLLRVLGQTRGHHTSIHDPNQDHEQKLRRRFLQNLSYICDFKKGGSTCTAIGLEESSTCYKFWVASNTVKGSAMAEVVRFLKCILQALQEANHRPLPEFKSEEATIVRLCIDFSAARIKEERKCVFRALEQCQRQLNVVTTKAASGLPTWIDSILAVDDYFMLCQFAYENRKSEYVTNLKEQARIETDKMGPHGKLSCFSLAVHYLGRLAQHFRAPLQLVEDANHLEYLLDPSHVYAIKPIPSVPQLKPDSHTTLPGILTRMLKQNDSERAEIENFLLRMDVQHNILTDYMEQYEHCKPQVHAEVQVLEFFYKENLKFVKGDRYVSCSKPACLCCELYFKYHPARMVVPDSSRKVWVKWGPPLVEHFKKNYKDSECQRHVLSKMIEEIRNNAISQILRQSPAACWHPDSRTGGTESWYSNSSSDEFSSTGLSDSEDVSLPEQQITSKYLTSAQPSIGSSRGMLEEGSDSDEAGGVSLIHYSHATK